ANDFECVSMFAYGPVCRLARRTILEWPDYAELGYSGNDKLYLMWVYGGTRTMWVRVVVAFVLLFLPSTLFAPAYAKRVALVVGSNKYDNLPRERQLTKAVNDARAIEGALSSVGFEVIKAEDVGRSAFNLAWQQLLNRVGPGDEVALFFSGHGVEID